jgi:hypothetical protein
MSYVFRKRSLPLRCNKGGENSNGCVVADALEAFDIENAKKNGKSGGCLSSLTPRRYGYPLSI